MSNAIKGGGNHELSTDINVITAEINAYQRVAGEAIFEIGRRLNHVKENDLAHGEWTRWLNQEVRISHEHARKFIKVYERFEKSTPVWGLLPSAMSVLFELTSFTDEELEQTYELPSGESKKPTEMSRREIEALKKALKEAEKREELERKERERLEEENEQLAKKADKPPIIKEVYPDDYESIRAENSRYKRKYGDGNVRTIGLNEREDMYRDFANELDALRIKYGAIATEGTSVNTFAEKEPEYARKVNKFNEFWKQYVKSVIEEQTIIEMESV